MVVSELRGEKIDIIPFNDEPARFVAKALSPARVREVLVDDETKEATVIVPDDQLSLAIGRDGQNARLAARLTGWKIDIKSETEFAHTEQEGVEYEGEEVPDGRCMALLANDRRCPNAVIEGSQYCGLPQHQALARFSTNQVAVIADLGDDEVALLADSDADEANVAAIVTGAEEAFEKAEAERLEKEAAAAKEAEEAAAKAAAEEAAAAEESEEEEAAEEPAAEGDAEETPDAETSSDESGDDAADGADPSEGTEPEDSAGDSGDSEDSGEGADDSADPDEETGADSSDGDSESDGDGDSGADKSEEGE